jgi:hypothetical protein
MRKVVQAELEPVAQREKDAEIGSSSSVLLTRLTRTPRYCSLVGI